MNQDERDVSIRISRFERPEAEGGKVTCMIRLQLLVWRLMFICFPYSRLRASNAHGTTIKKQSSQLINVLMG